MATHDYVIDNASGAGVRSDINSALQAIVSNNSSSTEPSPTFAYMYWQDTGNNLLKLRNSSNNGWITLRGSDGSFPNIEIASNFPLIRFNETSNSPFILIQDAGNLSLRHNGNGNTDYAFRITPNNSNGTIASGTSAKTVTFEKPFFTGFSGGSSYLPSVGITTHNMVSGDTVNVTNVTEAGFTVEIKNSSGNFVSRNFTYSAVGYGRGV